MVPGTKLLAGQTAEILVFVDLPDGELDDYGKGILSEGSRLADKLAVDWSVICFSSAGLELAKDMAAYGVERLVLIDTPEHLADTPDLQGRLLAAALKDRNAALLLPHNDLGGALAPLIAAESSSALFVEAISYEVEGPVLRLTRQILGSQVAVTQTWDGESSLVLTINPRVLSGVVLPSMQPGQVRVERWQPEVFEYAGRTRIVERIPPDPQTVDVAEAEVIISAGLGCNERSFAIVEELCRQLNASLGATRPAYDLGYTGFERMVGQTGKTVAPRFYLALGISGSMHHLGGIKDSKRVISVNIDPKAPIFPNSDEGFVADLREVLPLLIERLKSVTGAAA